MQEGFINEPSVLCVAGAKATVPACASALEHARSLELPIFYVYREYAVDGSDVEPVRFNIWNEGGRPLSAAARPNETSAFPPELAPQKGDTLLKKPRFSAFFETDLDEQLKSMGVNTVILTGTTTPNCIRTTCYDALSLNYNTIIIEDCTSSRSSEVQEANIQDMAYIGAQVITLEEFRK